MLTKKNKVITKKVKLLKSPWTHAIGLMFRRTLENESYIFAFRKPRVDAVHMAFMRFSIDIVWLDEKKRVSDLYENAKPWQKLIFFKNPAKYMIEMPSGLIKKHKITIGNHLDF
jgi:uncharacterized protein